jgi:dynein heavy chain 1
VKELQINLATIGRELETKNKQAEEKLKQMVEDQQIAEMKKKDSQELQIKLDQQNAAVNVKKEKAYAELANVEPMIAEAKSAVGSIKKQHLEELKVLARPPQAVVMTMVNF